MSKFLCFVVAITLLDFCPTTEAAILNVTGAAAVISPPLDVSTDAFESNTAAWLFAEQQNVTLSQDIAVDISVPGTSPSGGVRNLSAGIIPAGTQIDSYFIHFDSVDGDAQNPVVVSGSVTFDRDVLGLMVLSDNLNPSHAYPGLPTTLYSPTGELEIVGGGAGTLTNDQITLSPDRRTVSFNFRNGVGTDDCRIVTTAVPEPATWILLATAVVLCGAWRFRKWTVTSR